MRRALADLAAGSPLVGAAVATTLSAAAEAALAAGVGEPATVEPHPEPIDEPIPPRPETAPSARPGTDLEDLLTARWGIWLGSAALLLAGVFLIRYAVENALLGPGARCVIAGLLGVALLAAAEWLTRHEPPSLPGLFRTDQAPAALAAGGTAVLFGAAYGAGPFYELLPPLLAFWAMAVASCVGLFAALRYGPLTAATGIAGAFATPALVSTENPSYPGLFAYLTVVSAAALAVVRYTAWTWLGWATTIAGAIWVCLRLASGQDIWAAAVFVPVAAALNLALLPAAALDHPVGRRLPGCLSRRWAYQGSLVTQIAGYAPILGLFALSPIAVWRYTEQRLDRLPWVAALFGLADAAVLGFAGMASHRGNHHRRRRRRRVLPGAWAPDVIRPLIFTAALFAAFHAAVGLWLERRQAHPLYWAYSGRCRPGSDAARCLRSDCPIPNGFPLGLCRPRTDRRADREHCRRGVGGRAAACRRACRRSGRRSRARLCHAAAQSLADAGDFLVAAGAGVDRGAGRSAAAAPGRAGGRRARAGAAGAELGMYWTIHSAPRRSPMG